MNEPKIHQETRAIGFIIVVIVGDGDMWFKLGEIKVEFLIKLNSVVLKSGDTVRIITVY